MKKLLMFLPMVALCVQGWVVTEKQDKRYTTSLCSSAFKTSIARKQQTSPPVRASPIPKLSNEEFLQRLNVQLAKMKIKDAKSPLLSKDVGTPTAVTDFTST
jgi:hypothetical protein